jgi:hypothetical protein
MDRIRKIVGDMGLIVGFLYIVSRVLDRLFGGRVRLVVYHLVAQPVLEQPMLPARRGRSINVCEAVQATVYALPVDRPRAVLESRFAQDARCLVASSEGRFLGFLWIIRGAYAEDEVRCLFLPEPAQQVSWDFDVFVDPTARLGFAFMRLWDEANRLLSSEGVKWSISRISAFNAGSLASHRRLGLTRIASAAFLCVGPVQLMLATQAPYFHVALSAASRPVMRLQAPPESAVPRSE